MSLLSARPVDCNKRLFDHTDCQDTVSTEKSVDKTKYSDSCEDKFRNLPFEDYYYESSKCRIEQSFQEAEWLAYAGDVEGVKNLLLKSETKESNIERDKQIVHLGQSFHRYLENGTEPEQTMKLGLDYISALRNRPFSADLFYENNNAQRIAEAAGIAFDSARAVDIQNLAYNRAIMSLQYEMQTELLNSHFNKVSQLFQTAEAYSQDAASSFDIFGTDQHQEGILTAVIIDAWDQAERYSEFGRLEDTLSSLNLIERLSYEFNLMPYDQERAVALVQRAGALAVENIFKEVEELINRMSWVVHPPLYNKYLEQDPRKMHIREIIANAGIDYNDFLNDDNFSHGIARYFFNIFQKLEYAKFLSTQTKVPFNQQIASEMIDEALRKAEDHSKDRQLPFKKTAARTLLEDMKAYLTK